MNPLAQIGNAGMSLTEDLGFAILLEIVFWVLLLISFCCGVVALIFSIATLKSEIGFGLGMAAYIPGFIAVLIMPMPLYLVGHSIDDMTLRIGSPFGIAAVAIAFSFRQHDTFSFQRRCRLQVSLAQIHWTVFCFAVLFAFNRVAGTVVTVASAIIFCAVSLLAIAYISVGSFLKRQSLPSGNSHRNESRR